jgi:SAM-dependent methyltransferase
MRMSSSATFLDPVVIPLITGTSVLDVGCGYGRWGALIRSNFWEAGLSAPPAVDGLDAFEPNIGLCESSGAYRRVWLQRLPGPLDGHWDTVLASEVIEHVEQAEVSGVLDTLERAARKRVIITTPNFPYYRGGGDTIVGFNEFEAHHAYVPQEQLRQRGYRLLGAGFCNPRSFLFRVLRKLRMPGRRGLDSLPVVFPSLGHTTVAWKDIT